jgi:hypothetical protein
MNCSGRLNIHNYGIIFEKPLRIAKPLFNTELIPFYFFISQLVKPGTIVELGVCSGNTLAAFCQAVRFLGLSARCYGVDTWKGDIHVGRYDDRVYNELSSYMQKEYAALSQLLRMTFDEALEHFSDGMIDLLHVDGTHTYDAVSHDFESWLPKMSGRGVMLFHDTRQKKNSFGVWRLWEEVSGRYPSWEIDFASGLGVLAVGKEVNEDCLSFLEHARENCFYRDLFSLLGEQHRSDSKSKVLESIYRSRGWKALSLYYRVKTFLMGSGSRKPSS